MDGISPQRVERRLVVRHHAGPVPLAVRIRPGHEGSIVDVSPSGALIETVRRLLPGTVVDLQLETETERVAVRGRVVRCAVSSVHPCRIIYRGAVVFDRYIGCFGASPIVNTDRRSGLPAREAASQLAGVL